MTHLETLAYHIRSRVIDICEGKCSADNLQNRREFGKAFGDIEPCVKSGKACLSCVAEAERAG